MVLLQVLQNMSFSYIISKGKEILQQYHQKHFSKKSKVSKLFQSDIAYVHGYSIMQPLNLT